MPSNGRPLTTAEACRILDVAPVQLYRWRAADPPILTARKLPTAGTGQLQWDAEPVERLAKALPPKAPGRTRQARRYLRIPDSVLTQLPS